MAKFETLKLTKSTINSEENPDEIIVMAKELKIKLLKARNFKGFFGISKVLKKGDSFKEILDEMRKYIEIEDLANIF